MRQNLVNRMAIKKVTGIPASPSNSIHNFVFSKSVLVTELIILNESSKIDSRRTLISILLGTFVCNVSNKGSRLIKKYF